MPDEYECDTIAGLSEKTLLLLDDDGPLRNRLGRALESRGFETTLVESSVGRGDRSGARSRRRRSAGAWTCAWMTARG